MLRRVVVQRKKEVLMGVLAIMFLVGTAVFMVVSLLED